MSMIISMTGYSYIGCYANTKNNTKSLYQVYENEKFGFTIQFPLSWNGFYLIDESAKDYIKVCFVGKSETSKYFYAEGSKNIIGLPMFFIGNENYVKKNESIDKIRKIGISHKINYYYFTSTDYPIGVLYDVYNDSDNKDEKEKRKAYNDFLKAKQMEKDIDGILKTFKEK